MKNFKLCYVEGNFAYFTTQELDKQWGDDWDDAPYEHNAGTPYEPNNPAEKWEILKVAFDGDMQTPDCGTINSNWSVEQINRKLTPWLVTWDKKVAIFAGADLDTFAQGVAAAGGRVYHQKHD